MAPHAPPPRRLLAVDLDGTLVRADGAIAEADRAALARAHAAGVQVTLVTGRLVPSALAAARSLGIRTPLIAVDGAVTVCPRSGDLLEGTFLSPAALRGLLDCSGAHALAPFVCGLDAVLGAPAGRDVAGYLAGWSRRVRFPDRLEDAARRRDVVMVLAVGARDAVTSGLDAARRSPGGAVQLAAFPLGDGGPWALRALPAGASKGAALASLSARLGVPRARVAAVGDGLNDISMLAWAGASFVMGQADPEVRRWARHELRATAITGGGVAEVLSSWHATPA